ncbi:MAG: hypothetical protein M1830_009662 [Pleopsidium flavum]|nr:MAG: hypothetical protein M1830_009662 [Pleopsidium flavum]
MDMIHLGNDHRTESEPGNVADSDHATADQDDDDEEPEFSNTEDVSSRSRNNSPSGEPAQRVSQDQSPRKYRKTVHIRDYDEDMGPRLAEIILECRFYLLRYFTNRFSDALIRWTFGSKIKTTDHIYDVVYRRILSYCKNWKSVTLEAAVNHAHEMIKLDAADDQVLTHSTTDESIGSFFATRFSPENFTTVFPWLHKYLDVRRSSEFARFYFKSK